MGLRESRIINGVHPWLGARLQWLGEVAVLYGSVQTLISGWRSESQQLELYNNQTNRPAAYPGCSQHNYGFAADAVWAPAVQISSKARPLVFGQAETDRVMNNAARHASLTLVANDTGHVQMYNGLVFREWAVAHRLCPAVPPIPLLQQSNNAYRDCLLNATRLNREGFRGTLSCPPPCGPLFGTVCA